MSWQEKQKELRKNVVWNNQSYYDDCCDALFLSEVMKDREAMRKLFHDGHWAASSIAKTFYEYYYHKDKAKVVKEIEDIDNKCMERGGGFYHFAVSWKKLKMVSDWGDNEKESNWMNLDRYDKEHNGAIYTFNGWNKKYENVSVIDLLEDVVKKRNRIKVKDYCQETGNEHLDLMLGNLRRNESDVNLDVYTKMLKLLNGDVKDYLDGKKELERGHYNAIVFADILSNRVVEKIDYPMQFGFHKTKLCEEMLKFSYITTFNKDEAREEDMNNYVERIKAAGHWRVAIKMISYETAKHSMQERGVNKSLFRLAEIKPISKDCKAAEEYHKTDTEHLSRGKFYLGR
jgi:hypothetical protein